MSAVTATWAIPYATSTDVFCDAYLTIQAMAERVDEILDVFDFDEARTSVIPLARIGFNGAQQVNDGTTQVNTTFTQVDFDTTNLADLSVDPTSLVLEADQLVLAGAYGNWDAPSLTAGQEYDLTVEYASSGIFAGENQRANGSGAGMHISMTGFRSQGSTADRIVLELSALGTSTVNVTTARLWVMKMGDL